MNDKVKLNVNDINLDGNERQITGMNDNIQDEKYCKLFYKPLLKLRQVIPPDW